MGRAAALRDLFAATAAAIAAAPAVQAEIPQAAARIFADLDAITLAPGTPGQMVRACDCLAPALAAARAVARTAEVAEALAVVVPHLVWRRRAGDDPAFASGHGNAQIVGPEGLARSETVRLGASLLAPGVTYPDHHHPPEEIYLVLSEGEWRQTGRDWHAPGIGGLVYSPPDIMHAMRSHAAPLLALWCLWSPPP